VTSARVVARIVALVVALEPDVVSVAGPAVEDASSIGSPEPLSPELPEPEVGATGVSVSKSSSRSEEVVVWIGCTVVVLSIVAGRPEPEPDSLPTVLNCVVDVSAVAT